MPHASLPSCDYTDTLLPPAALPHPDLNYIPPPPAPASTPAHTIQKSIDGKTSAPRSGDLTPLSQHIHHAGLCSCVTPDDSEVGQFRRRQSQQVSLAKRVAMSSMSGSGTGMNGSADGHARRTSEEEQMDELRNALDRTLSSQSGSSQHHQHQRNGGGSGTSHVHFDNFSAQPSKPVPMPSRAGVGIIWRLRCPAACLKSPARA